MALQVAAVTREFVVIKDKKSDNIVLKDPHPDMTIEEVISFYKSTYPEIAASQVSGPKVVGDKAVYSLKTEIGTHG